MKKILIALDYNPSAQTVAETGYTLAKDMQVQVILLHVMEEPAYYATYEYSPIMGFNSNFIGPETLPPNVNENIRGGAEAFLQKSKQHLADDGIETMVQEGIVADTIVKAALDINASIIVLGSHSRRGLDKILMGSVAEKVLHSSPIPLFIIPTKG